MAKVNIKSKAHTTFNDILIGHFFIFDTRLYIKTSHHLDSIQNAYQFDNNRLAEFNGANLVIKLDQSKITINVDI